MINVAVVYAVMLYFISGYSGIAVPLCTLALIIITVFLKYRRSLSSVLSLAVISFGLNIAVTVISALLCTPISGLMADNISQNSAYMIKECLINVLNAVITLCIFKIKRIKDGLTPLKNDTAYNVLTTVSLWLIFGDILYHTEKVARIIPGLIFIFLTCGGITVFIWLRRSIVRSRQRKLLLRNYDTFKEIVSAQEREINELHENIDSFSKIVHEDRKFIPSVKMGLINIIESSNEERIVNASKELAEQMEQNDSESKNAIDDYNKLSYGQTHTGIAMLDGTIRMFVYKASLYKCGFEFVFSDEARAVMPTNSRALSDFMKVLSDLTENALIAAKSLPDGRVKTEICTEDGALTVNIFDNGAQFDSSVISVIGRKKVTTHEDTGGSGTGLVSTFEILGIYGGTFIIDECLPETDIYTKRVAVIYDGKNARILITRRKTVKKICDGRNNLTCELYS